MRFGMLSGEFFGQLRRYFAGHQPSLLCGDLLGRHPLLALVEFGDLVAVLDRVDDQLLHGVEVGVAHRGQLDRWHVEVVFDPVLDPHRHQRVQAEFDQRHLPGQILGLVAHRAAHDQAEPVMHGLAGVRGPLAEAGRDAGTRGEVVVQDVRVVGRLGLGFGDRRHRDGHPGSDRGRQRRLRTRTADDRVIDQGERLADARVHLHRRTAGVTGERRHQPGTVLGKGPLFGSRQCRIRKHLHRGGFHQCGKVGRPVGRVLPHVAAIRHCNVCAGEECRPVGREPGIEPVLLALESRRRDVGVVIRARGASEQRPHVQIVSVDVQLGHRGDHRVDLVLLAGQGGDQLPIVQARRSCRQPDLHQRHGVGREFDEGGVPVVDGVTDSLGEVDAVTKTLLPVVDVMNRLSRPDVSALVHGREVADRQRPRGDALQLGGQLTEQRVHLGGVAGALGLKLPGELSLRLAALDDRIHLGRRTADDGL